MQSHIKQVLLYYIKQVMNIAFAARCTAVYNYSDVVIVKAFNIYYPSQ